MSRCSRSTWTASLALGLTLAVANPSGAAPADDPPWATAERLVREIYTAVSATGGGTPDWNRIRGFFLPEAIIVLRTSRTATTTFSVDGFLKDFTDFYERPIKVGDRTVPPKEAGFTERVVTMKSWEYGDIAHALVLYEAHIPGSPRPPQQGIDSWELVRRDGRWWIAAVTNEIVTAERPVPPELRQDP